MIAEKFQQKKRNRVEIYNSIISKMKQLNTGNLNDTEIHEAARNLIGLYEIIIDYQKDKNKTLQPKQNKYYNDSS
ncbi:MAG: hypothetical protein HRU35_03225 [Rickettsiaceae bacterium]|nr:hypothetical protein [Rickettsiaceae bacterium]